MLVLITYDVETMTAAGKKRLRLMARECKNYGIRVQNSVFECVLDTSQFIKLKARISSIIEPTSDSVRFYLLGSKWERKIEMLGRNYTIDVESELIV